LIKFLNSGSGISMDQWYNFDRITFATGSATIDREKSSDQISNITEILKAYENMEIKIGGYTDNTGSEEANMNLSAARANAVKAALVAAGIDGARIATEGYGIAHPVATNDTPEGRAQNPASTQAVYQHEPTPWIDFLIRSSTIPSIAS